MTRGDSHREDWSLRKATAADIEALMAWFGDQHDVVIWGGPTFRYPFTRETFFEDIYWQKMASYCMAERDDFVGFGQLYERDGRIHLARLVVRPDVRGRGAGKRLIEMLMDVGATLFPGDEFSLFVLRDNIPAYECYKSLGFVVGDYPSDMPYADVCDYLTRPVQSTEK
jgi:ribosomal protein S18 acetylase RimI-like enzyme